MLEWERSLLECERSLVEWERSFVEWERCLVEWERSGGMEKVFVRTVYHIYRLSGVMKAYELYLLLLWS